MKAKRRVKQTVEDVLRLKQIASVFFELELYHLIELFSLKYHLPWHKRFHKQKDFGETQPETVREIFERLGGAFLKLGQLLALRPDLVGVEYAKAFEKLLEHVEPLGWEDVKDQLDECLPKGVATFKSIEKNAIASASIAQVHRAVLYDGTVVAVKIRRPNIKKKFRSDIAILRIFTKVLSKRYNLGFMNPEKVIEEFEEYTLKELDLTHEARNMRRFRRNFANDSSVHIPTVYSKLSNEKVLVMEFIDGEALLKRRPHSLNREVIIKLTSAVYTQLFEHGFFHADLHPGNIYVIPARKKRGKKSELQIAFLDFGIAGYIDSVLKDQIADLFVALVSGSLEKTAMALIALNTTKSNPGLRDLEIGIYHAIGEFYGLPLEEMPVAQMFHNCIDVARKNKISLPAQMVLFSKSLLTLDGSCRELDPDFDVVGSATPHVRKMMAPKIEIKELPQKSVLFLLELKKVFGRVPLTLQQLDHKFTMLEQQMSEIDNTFHYLSHVIWRISKIGIYALLFASFLISSSILIHTGPMYNEISWYSIISGGVGLLLILLILLNLRDKTDVERNK